VVCKWAVESFRGSIGRGWCPGCLTTGSKTGAARGATTDLLMKGDGGGTVMHDVCEVVATGLWIRTHKPFLVRTGW
jgi:hypothetical protein